MKHSALYYAYIRRQVVKGLIAKGKSRQESRRLAAYATSEDIDKESDKVQLRPHGKVGGPFVDWIVDHREQIFEVIKAVITILLMFAAKKEENDG